MPNLNAQWAMLLIEELVRCGCSHFFISPGSRSAPLAAAVAQHSTAKSLVCHDERSTAFAALGFARARNKPGVIIVTSGTAVANLFPAIVEASTDRVPMIILSADLPSAMRDVGATQAIDQVKIYGSYVRWQHSLAPHDTSLAVDLLATVDFLVHQSLHPLPGPVQLNCMFDEPLAPLEQSFDFPAPNGWIESLKPHTVYTVGESCIAEENMTLIAHRVQKAERGLVVLGAQANLHRNEQVEKLLKQLHWPVFADVTSGYRLTQDCVLPHLDKIPQHYDVILQLGGRIISKRLNNLLKQNKGTCHIMVDDHAQRIDAHGAVTERVVCSIPLFCDQLALRIHGHKDEKRLKRFFELSEHIEKTIDAMIEDNEDSIEIHVARKISSAIKDQSGLFLSNSMSMRDMDNFAVSRNQSITIAANRGTNGSDGITSSACGFAWGLEKPTTLLMGDMAFLHDVNGLSLLRDIHIPMTIVVINNCGGGIFSFLPIAQFPHLLTPYTDGSHNFGIGHVCAAFGIKHEKVETKHDFNVAYERGLQGREHRVIEVTSNKKANVALHRSIDEAIAHMFL